VTHVPSEKEIDRRQEGGRDTQAEDRRPQDGGEEGSRNAQAEDLGEEARDAEVSQAENRG
jgi:hypothetical protein